MAYTFSSDCLITSATFTAVTGIVDTTLTATEKSRIELMVNAASQQIKDYTDRQFLSASYTEVHDAQGSDLIFTREYPVVSISSVKLAANGDFASATALDAANYCTDGNAVYLRFISTPRGRGNVQVVYTAGYASIPYPVQLSVCAQFMYLNKVLADTGLIGLNSISKMGESMTKEDTSKYNGICVEAVGLLDSYKRKESGTIVMFARVS